MSSITVIMTCHNRKINTECCIRSIYDSDYDMRYIVVDDGSTDGTKEILNNLKQEFQILILEGSGCLYWAGGMRLAMKAAVNQRELSDYYLLVNDDVKIYKGAVSGAVLDSVTHKNAVIVGTTENKAGNMTYGGIRYKEKSIQYDMVGNDRCCDTFNCNFVLLSRDVFLKCSSFDEHFTHAMADFDYGFSIKKKGFLIYTSSASVGMCERNEKTGTWQDTTLSRIKRIQLKEGKKGLPAREWFYFLHKNFGLQIALIRSITPYIKILINRS